MAKESAVVAGDGIDGADRSYHNSPQYCCMWVKLVLINILVPPVQCGQFPHDGEAVTVCSSCLLGGILVLGTQVVRPAADLGCGCGLGFGVEHWV